MFLESTHQADLGNGYYENPILDGDYADPAVCRVGEDYYLCVSTGPFRPCLSIFHSKDLVNWKFVCHPMKNFPYDLWAPDIFQLNGLFYIYFSAHETNFVIYSDRIDGGWSEPIDLKIGGIDPGHCVDQEGNRYLFLSVNSIVPLTPDGLATCGEQVQVLAPAPIPEDWEVTGSFCEAPNVFYKDGYYYLTYADGGSFGPATAHMIVSARARNLYGPWEYSPYNPVVHTYSREEKWHTKGHGHFVEDTEGKWWVIYHAYEKGYLTHGRKLLLSPVEFTDDGWFRVTTPADAPTRKPAGEIIEDESTFSDDFTGDLWKKGWGTLHETDLSRYTSGHGVLTIQAIPETVGKGHPLTINTGDHSYEITVRVAPQKNCEAGVLLQYNESVFSALSLCNGELLFYRVGRQLRRYHLGEDACYLKLYNHDQYLTFYYSLDGETYHKIPHTVDISSQHTNTYLDFLSQRPGIFVVGEGSADFSTFVYKGHW